MNWIKKWFGDKGISFLEDELIEENVCPNCWGKQEYNDEFIAYVEDKTKANLNKDALQPKTFIESFVEQNISGIRLKKDGEQLSCPSCKGKFKKVSSKTN